MCRLYPKGIARESALENQVLANSKGPITSGPDLLVLNRTKSMHIIRTLPFDDGFHAHNTGATVR